MQKLKGFIKKYYEGLAYLFFGEVATLLNLVVFAAFQAAFGTDFAAGIGNVIDNPAVRVKGENEIIVYGTPWSGKTPCYRNLQYPIGAFVRLEQHPQNIIAKESPLKAFASIISSCSTMIWDKPSYAHIMHTAEAVAKKIAVYYLKCRADEEAAKLSYQTISKH